VNPPAIERAGPETPHLQQGALDLYPNRATTMAGGIITIGGDFHLFPRGRPAATGTICL
jgi:hypothetical protein